MNFNHEKRKSLKPGRYFGPPLASGNWLRTKLSRKELKAMAEKAARKDAVKRAKRRKQL